jgi:cytochrome c-type biogenesis protein
MVESLFISANEWMASGSSLAAIGCFVWGLISVLFSPCHLGSIPLMVAYVGGQRAILRPRQAAVYAVVFSLGLFISIAVVGAVCAWLGRMLGDIGSWWQSLIGAILIWAAMGMLGIESCSVSANLLSRVNLRGLPGALALGLGYGILSGSCTFGFVAPILAIITLQQQVVTGVFLILAFAAGHCLPIALAGSFTAAVRRVVDNDYWQGAGNLFRKGSACIILLMGIYFSAKPILEYLGV